MSDLAHETRVQPQNAPPTPAASVASAPAPALISTAASGNRQGDVHSLASVFSGLSDAKTATALTGDKRSEGKFPSWTSQNWRSLGGSVVGNRLGDTPQTDPKKPKEPAKIKNATVGAPTIGNVDLSKIPKTTTNPNNGLYHESALGTFAEAKPGSYKYNKDGESADLYTARAVAGAREQVGIHGAVEEKGRFGAATVAGDAFALAEAGADANASYGSNGLQGSTNASARAGIGVKGDADLKSVELVKIPGVAPVTAGIGAHADGFVGGRLAAGLKAGIGPKFTGLEGKVGGFAGAEGNIDAHANLGPLKAKLGASGYAGIGAEASGGISLEDWKLHVGGKIGAALGLGGAISFDGTVDLKQAAQLELEAAKHLTPANQAKVLAGTLNGGAALANDGWGGVKEFLDPEHTNHFSRHGLGVRAGRIGDGIRGTAHDAKDWAGDKLHDAGQAVGHAKDWAGDKLHDAEHWTGAKLHDAKDWADDKLHDAGQAARFAITHPGQALRNAKDWAGDKLHDTGQALGNAKGWASGKLHDATSWAGAKLHDVQDWAGDKLHAAGQSLGNTKDWASGKLHGAKDWVGDKLHDASATAKYALTHPGETLHNAKNWAGDRVHDAGQALSTAKDWAGSKVHDAKDWAGSKVHDAGQALSNAKDWAGDKLDTAGVAAKYAATHPGETLHNAKDWADSKVHDAKDWAGSKVHDAKDWAGDRVVAAGRGLVSAKEAVASGASTVYDGVRNNFKEAGSTIANGASSAWGSLKSTGRDIKHFFGS